MTKIAKKTPKFFCEKCHFECCKQSDYNRHLVTAKHARMTNGMTKTAENEKNIFVSKTGFNCICGKSYSFRQGLHKHQKVCNYKSVTNECQVIQGGNENNSSQLNNDVVMALIKDNEEMRKTLHEQQEQHNKQIQDLIPQLQQVTNVNNTTNNTNCNNKFNLNFFLNEQCKDAISIQHFIENLNIGIRELEHMGDVGYVKGMMSIFSETLGKMNIYERPLHCTDLKRDTLYIKQGDTWMKDTEDKTELKKLVETVKCRNYGSLRLWEREHPEAFECDTQDNIDYMRISSESLGGFNSTDSIKLNKIIKHVVKEVYVK